MKYIIITWSALFLISCGGSGGPTESVETPIQATDTVSGYTVDDYVLNGSVTFYDADGNTVATTTTLDYGYFSAKLPTNADYKIVITGGVQDVDGLSTTTNDQKPNTAQLSALMPKALSGNTLMVSAISTGLSNFASRDINLYSEKLAQIQKEFPGALYMPIRSKPIDVLGGVALLTSKVGGYTNLVKELSDDGSFNGSVVSPAVSLAEIKTLVSSIDSTGIGDPALLSCIFENFPDAENGISGSIVESITNLFCSGYSIRNLKGIGILKNLEGISLLRNNITDISPLIELPKLRYIGLSGNYLSSFDATGLADGAMVSLSNNCLKESSVTAGKASLIGTRDSQKSASQCATPRSLGLRAMVNKGKSLLISYAVQDAQSAKCELDVLGSKNSIKCDGNTHLLKLNGLETATSPAPLVKMYVDGLLIDSTPIEFYGYDNSKPISVAALIEQGSYSAKLDGCSFIAPRKSGYCTHSKVLGSGGKISQDHDYALKDGAWIKDTDNSGDHWSLTSTGWKRKSETGWKRKSEICAIGESATYSLGSDGATTVKFCDGTSVRMTARTEDASGKTLLTLGLNAPARFSSNVMPAGSQLSWITFANTDDNYYLFPGNMPRNWATKEQDGFASLGQFIEDYTQQTGGNPSSSRLCQWSDLAFSFAANGGLTLFDLETVHTNEPKAIGTSTYTRRTVHGVEVLLINTQAPQSEPGERIIFAVKDGKVYGGAFRPKNAVATGAAFNKTMINAILNAGGMPAVLD